MAKKVLIIEDNSTDASIVKSLLMEEGVEVEVAVTGEEGITKAREIVPDLVILDLRLPDIDGFEVCARLKKEAGLVRTIVVILSIKDSAEDIKRAFQLNADDYIIKPSQPEFLIKKIKLYLGMR